MSVFNLCPFLEFMVPICCAVSTTVWSEQEAHSWHSLLTHFHMPEILESNRHIGPIFRNYVFPQFTQSSQSRSGWAGFLLHSAAPSCRRAQCPSAPTAPAKVPLSHLRQREGGWLSLRFEAFMLIVNFC